MIPIVHNVNTLQTRLDDMQYNKESKIATVDDVKEFFQHLINDRKLNFHPDDRFEDYVSHTDRSNTFSQEECVIYNRLMDESFNTCEKSGEDIYAIGVELMQKAIAQQQNENR